MEGYSHSLAVETGNLSADLVAGSVPELRGSESSLFFILLLNIFWLCSMWGLSSPARDQTRTLCRGNPES